MVNGRHGCWITQKAARGLPRGEFVKTPKRDEFDIENLDRILFRFGINQNSPNTNQNWHSFIAQPSVFVQVQELVLCISHMLTPSLKQHTPRRKQQTVAR